MLGPFVRMLTGYPDPNVVAEALQSGVLAPYGAISVMIYHRAHELELDQIGSYGNPAEISRMSTRISVRSDVPVARACRTGIVQVAAHEELSEVFIADLQFPRMGPGGFVSAPIMHSARSIGAYSFVRLDNYAYTPLDLDLFETISHLLGLWLEPMRQRLGTARPVDHGHAPLSLSVRQKEILRLLLEGKTSDQIAQCLSYSTSTVKQEIVRMKSGLQVSSRQELVDYAVRLSLLA